MNLRIEEKLETLVRLLDDWRLTKKIFPLKVSYLESSNPSLKEIKKARNWKPFNKPYTIYQDNTYFWFKCEFDINKKNDKNLKSYLGVDTYLDRFKDCNLRPQGVLYLNDKLISGVDINHCDTLINEDGHYEMYLFMYIHDWIQSRSYTNEHNQPVPFEFSIKYTDKRAEDAYYDYWTILDGLKILLKDDKRYIEATKVINEAMNLIDLRNRDEKFFTSLAKSRTYLLTHYFKNKKICGKEDYTINCIGHAHIDMAWLWDLEQTHHKGIRTFATALKMMEEYPEYRYLHTSPQLYKFIQKDDPALFARVKKAVKSGQFEIDGAMWVEPDCNLTSGESLVRQILYGKEYIKKEFNVDSKTLILPDVFGYAYQIPQILSKSGVNRFVTAKIGWNDTNRLPYDSFKWIGLDGSSVFTYLISTCDASPRTGVTCTTYTTYNGWMSSSHLIGTWNRYEDKKYNNVVFTTYGYGDGGGGPTREMIEKSRRYAYGLPGLGKAKLATLKDTLNEIEKNFNKACVKYKKTPTWNNELYLEFHRGTYTSVPRIKKYNRELEFSFQNAELASSLNTIINKVNYPQSKIIKNYETFLLHQFHDILPGSAIAKVYQDADRYLGNIKKDNKAIINENLNGLFSKSKNKYLVFNPNSFTVTEPVMVDNRCYIVKDVPSIGYKALKLEHQPNQIKVGERRLSNEYFDIKFNENGEITSLLDKVNKKEIVAKGEAINKFVVYEDMPYQYDNWELSVYYKQKHYPLSKTATFTKLDEGDRKGFKITHHYYKSEVIQYIYLYNKINRIDFVNDIKWKEKRQLLKVHFPLNVKCEQARFDVQFGSIGRNTKPKNSYDEAKFEVCAQKWVDMSDGKYGVALLNDGKYGHSVSGNNLALTILKSGSYPFPGATDIFPSFKFSLFPHKGDYRTGEVTNQAYLVNRPSVLISKPDGKYVKEEKSFMNVNAKGVYLETVKKAHRDDSFIIRGYEASNKERDILIKINVPFKNAYLTDLMEKDLKKLSVNKGVIKYHVKPFEIFTMRIK